MVKFNYVLCVSCYEKPVTGPIPKAEGGWLQII